VAVSATIAVGCGSGGEPEAQPAKPTAKAAAETLPRHVNIVLEGGRPYKTRVFEPSLELTVPKGGTWLTAGTPEVRGSVALVLDEGRRPPNTLSVNRIEAVADPRRGALDRADGVEAPSDFIAWLQDHPRLEASKPTTVHVDGLEGRQIDVTAKSTPKRMPDSCTVQHGADCLPVFFAGDVPIVYAVGDHVRFTVLEAAGGPLVIEQFASPPAQFVRVLKLMKPVVDSLKITGQ
jgi:hypothetical protein